MEKRAAWLRELCGCWCSLLLHGCVACVILKRIYRMHFRRAFFNHHPSCQAPILFEGVVTKPLRQWPNNHTLGSAAVQVPWDSLEETGGREESWWLAGRKRKERTGVEGCSVWRRYISSSKPRKKESTQEGCVWPGSGIFPKVGKEIQGVPIKVRNMERG